MRREGELKLKLHSHLNNCTYLTIMTSYAAILSMPKQDTPVSVPLVNTSSVTYDDIMTLMKTVTTAPDELRALIASLRPDMESSSSTPNFRNGVRTFGQVQDTKSNGWKGGRFGPTQNSSAFAGKGESKPHMMQSAPSTKPAVVRYQSRFTSGNEGNLDGKILNTIIGNKLNAFTQLTYNDTRDFIYQIMDSGETEFIKDFVEKVFKKATSEELYCALFAKLIAEIAKTYPIMYGEMNKYHNKFLDVFDDIDECGQGDSSEEFIKKQYRMGYGHFLSELAGNNALETGQLISMIDKVMTCIYTLSSQEGKVKSVEECTDCIVRLVSGLKSKSPSYFNKVKEEIRKTAMDRTKELISKKGVLPSVSAKTKFGLMDFQDLIV